MGGKESWRFWGMGVIGPYGTYVGLREGKEGVEA